MYISIVLIVLFDKNFVCLLLLIYKLYYFNINKKNQCSLHNTHVKKTITVHFNFLYEFAYLCIF